DEAARAPRTKPPREAGRSATGTGAGTGTNTGTLPWFTPDTDPGTGTAPAAGQLSAPSENSPTTKGNT
ncbi:MAG: hypothetical protein WCD21_44470, partial [Streptomyces sp.]